MLRAGGALLSEHVFVSCEHFNALMFVMLFSFDTLSKKTFRLTFAKHPFMSHFVDPFESPFESPPGSRFESPFGSLFERPFEHPLTNPCGRPLASPIESTLKIIWRFP